MRHLPDGADRHGLDHLDHAGRAVDRERHADHRQPQRQEPLAEGDRLAHRGRTDQAVAHEAVRREAAVQPDLVADGRFTAQLRGLQEQAAGLPGREPPVRVVEKLLRHVRGGEQVVAGHVVGGRHVEDQLGVPHGDGRPGELGHLHRVGMPRLRAWLAQAANDIGPSRHGRPELRPLRMSPHACREEIPMTNAQVPSRRMVLKAAGGAAALTGLSLSGLGASPAQAAGNGFGLTITDQAVFGRLNYFRFATNQIAWQPGVNVLLPDDYFSHQLAPLPGDVPAARRRTGLPEVPPGGRHHRPHRRAPADRGHARRRHRPGGTATRSRRTPARTTGRRST